MKFISILLLCLTALVVLLFVVPVRIRCRVDTSAALDFSVSVRVLFIKRNLYPRKKNLPDLKKFRREALEKRYARKQKQDEKKRLAKEKKAARKLDKQKKQAAKAAKTGVKSPKRSIRHIIKLVLALLRVLCERFGRYLRVDIRHFDIIAAAKNPADTAVLYGWIYTAMEAFWGSFSQTKPFSRVKKNSISIYADFLRETPAVRADITMSIALWQVITILMHAGGTALTVENERRKTESMEEKAARKAAQAQARADMIKELKQ